MHQARVVGRVQQAPVHASFFDCERASNPDARLARPSIRLSSFPVPSATLHPGKGGPREREETPLDYVRS
eukprot:scaffold1501_cov352-Pavlova_lutheri.AAC.42